MDLETTTGVLYWDNNWVTFLDGFLQQCVLGADTQSLVLPAKARYLRIDPEAHMKSMFKLGTSTLFW